MALLQAQTRVGKGASLGVCPLQVLILWMLYYLSLLNPLSYCMIFESYWRNNCLDQKEKALHGDSGAQTDRKLFLHPETVVLYLGALTLLE